MDLQSIKQEVIVALKLQDLEPEEQEAVFADVGQNIISQIMLDAYDMLPAEAQADFKKKAEAGDLDGTVEILEQNVANYENLVRKASQKVIAELSE